MSEPTIIDTKMHGRDAITAAYLLSGERTALVETGPMSSVDHVLEGLRRAGVDHLDHIVLTHIHLDHAGAAGTLARHHPKATVVVHGVGAPHLVDPSKLWNSASRIYGGAMETLWGGIEPIPEDRIVVLEDGDKVDLGGRYLQAVETPGHAYHHHAFVDDATGIVFTGDAIGVRLPEIRLVRPATPPPELHVEKAVASIERIKTLGATTLYPTHFGPIHHGDEAMTVDEACDAAISSLRTWQSWVNAARRRTSDLDEATRIVEQRARAEMEGDLEPHLVDRLEQTTSYRMNVWGYMRYLDKQEEAASGG